MLVIRGLILGSVEIDMQLIDLENRILLNLLLRKIMSIKMIGKRIVLRYLKIWKVDLTAIFQSLQKRRRFSISSQRCKISMKKRAM